jgi:hypothetical protein
MHLVRVQAAGASDKLNGALRVCGTEWSVIVSRVRASGPMSQDFKSKLKTLLAGRADIDIGQFKLLGLSEIRTAAGDNWPRLKSRVFTAGSQLIARHAGPNDIVMPCGDGFLVLMADTCEDKAVRLDAIGAKLRDFFLGAADLEAMAVETSVRTAKAEEAENLARTVSTGETDVERRHAPRPAPAETDPSRDGARIPFFRPVWDAHKHAIAANACHTKVTVGGRALDGRRVIETRMAPVTYAELDHIAQTAGFDALMRAVRAQKPTKICLAIHAETWAEKTERDTILGRFNRLPDGVRSAFLVRFDGLAGDLPATAEALRELGETGVSLVAEIPFGETDLSAFDDLDIQLFGCRCRPPANLNSEGLLDHDKAALSALVKTAQARGGATCLQDVRDIYVLKEAMACGIRFFSGQTVVADRQTPAPMQALSMMDIYRMQKSS